MLNTDNIRDLYTLQEMEAILTVLGYSCFTVTFEDNSDERFPEKLNIDVAVRRGLTLERLEQIARNYRKYEFIEAYGTISVFTKLLKTQLKAAITNLILNQ